MTKAAFGLMLANWAMCSLLALVFEAPLALRLLFVGTYLLVAFGAAATRRVPGLRGAESVSMSIAASLAVLILTSQAFIVLDIYDPLLIFVTIGAVTTVLSLTPESADRQP